MPMWSSKNIVSCLDAQMSIPFAISLAAHRVPNGPEWQDVETMTNPRFLAFMDKVTVQAHPDFERVIKQEPGSRIGKVDVLARGRIFTEEHKYRKGSPASEQTRMTDEELVAKFGHNVERVLHGNKAAELADALMNLEEVADVSRLARLWEGQTQHLAGMSLA
jgi:2-methylcitrate dehydratase PrpD